jgi:hypothetical protein
MRARLFGTVIYLTLVASGAQGQGREIQIVLEHRCVMSLVVLTQAQLTATRIYAGIGVKLKWSNAMNSRIRMEIHTQTPNTVHPGAFGYALPYRDHGISIHLLLDRIAGSPSGDGPEYRTAVLLGHVMAHELGHVLERDCRHSETGVMKAHWDYELRQMQFWPLCFDPEDAELIRNGVAQWQR